jgi:2'-5' RNA ligase
MSIADLRPGQHATDVRNHWWWRPGWRIGRRFYAFHITLEDQPDLWRLAETYRTALSAWSTVTLVPDQWLHMTMQGIGFTDEIDADQVAHIARECQALLDRINETVVTFGEIVVSEEAIAMPAIPGTRIDVMRTATRTAIAKVLGEEHLPEDAEHYRPHVSVAYIKSDGPATPLRQCDAVHWRVAGRSPDLPRRPDRNAP